MTIDEQDNCAVVIIIVGLLCFALGVAAVKLGWL
jgi:hypothetical protein